MDSAHDFYTLRDMLAWQIELGAEDALLDAPLDRYSLPSEAPRAVWQQQPAPPLATAPKTPAPPPPAFEVDVVAEAEAAASAAPSLGALQAAMQAYPHCEFKKGARNFVFSDGLPGAEVMIIGEAPGREEDREGRPFVGPAGQLLDKMFQAIGLSRQSEEIENALYIANVLPWRPPENRGPSEAEVAMLLPFLRRHIALANPKVIVLMGNAPLQALTGETGILRQRGQWREVLGRPALPMAHPAYLLRIPEAKRDAWADLLALKAHLLKDKRHGS